MNAVHVEFVLLRLATEYRMILENKATTFAVMHEIIRRGDPAKPSSDNNEIVDVVNIGQVGDRLWILKITYAMGCLYYASSVSVSGGIVTNACVPGPWINRIRSGRLCARR